MPATLDPTRCPLCGEPNACGMAAGSEECWCFTATISPEALNQLPAEARGKVCVCAKCGSGAFPAKAPPRAFDVVK